MGISIKSIFISIAIIVTITFSTALLPSCNIDSNKYAPNDSEPEGPWYGWNKYQIKPEDSLVRLGYYLIDSTSLYFGPKGKIATTTNGMNCQNCHILGGIIPWGNNFSATIMSYPSFSIRSGTTWTLATRINGCFERSLNGSAIDTTSREMQAIIAYMHWLGDDIPRGKKPIASGIMKLSYLDRPADPVKGNIVYVTNCRRCHGKNGEGLSNKNASGFVYPPLWGPDSYNTGAGLYRLSNFAGFVKNNMPFDKADYKHPQLSDEEAWDVAAFVNSQPRPSFDNSKDYPDLSKKPIDYPFAPFADTFSELQHKYGPFKPIEETKKKLESN